MEKISVSSLYGKQNPTEEGPLEIPFRRPFMTVSTPTEQYIIPTDENYKNKTKEDIKNGKRKGS